jgi:hypothetical protein
MDEKKKEISQDEIDKLGIKSDISIQEDIKNIIILIRNELNIVDKEVLGYDNEKAVGLKKNLNKILEKIINIRK